MSLIDVQLQYNSFVMDIDNVFTRIGDFGLSQKKIFFILSSAQTFLGVHALILAFIGPEPLWTCDGETDPASRCAQFETGKCSPEYSDDFSSIVSQVAVIVIIMLDIIIIVPSSFKLYVYIIKI